SRTLTTRTVDENDSAKPNRASVPRPPVTLTMPIAAARPIVPAPRATTVIMCSAAVPWASGWSRERRSNFSPMVNSSSTTPRSETSWRPSKAVNPTRWRQNPAVRNPTRGGMRTSWARNPNARAAAMVMTRSAMPSSSLGRVRAGPGPAPRLCQNYSVAGRDDSTARAATRSWSQEEVWVLQTFGQRPLTAVRARGVVALAPQRFGQILMSRHPVGVGVGVLVALPVSEFLGAGIVGVALLGWHLPGQPV